MVPTQETDPSHLYIERIAQYVPLAPLSFRRPLEGICVEVFSPLLLTYHPPVRGVVLAYSDVSLSSRPPKAPAPAQRKSKAHRTPQEEEIDVEDLHEEEGVVLTRCIDEYTTPYVWASASLLVWRPEPGTYLTARVTHMAATHISLSHLNTFSISILKDHLPQTWRWHTEQKNKKRKGGDGRIVDEGGWWVDGEGETVEKGAEMRVRVREWDVRGGKGRGHLRIEGSLVSVEEEKGRKKGKSAEGNGEAVEVD